MIDFATIERIQSAARIEEVVGDFITLRKRGVNYVGLCPFHEDKSPSFYVSPAKNICKCFACGEGGTPVHFIMKHEQLAYGDALKYLAKKYGIEVKEKELTDEQKQKQGDRESMFILNSFAQKNFSSNLFNHPEGIAVGLSYFKERGFREDIINKFQLGYALEQKDAFSQKALKSGYKKEFLERTGLSITGENNYIADRFRGRVMFPVHSLSGKVIAFGGRILKKDDKIAKYVNSPESDIYHKGNELYGIYFARQSMVKHDKCFLVEGYTDVISMHQAGIENVVASSGTALTPGQIKLIHRFTNHITVLYDGDAAGIKAAIRGIDLLLEEGMNIKIVLLPEGEDPDSFARKQNASSLIEYIKANEVDFVRFKTNLLIEEAGNDPIKKAQLITEIVDTIAIIPEEIIRLLYVKECSRLLSVDEKVLLNAILKKRKDTLEKKKNTQNFNQSRQATTQDDEVSKFTPANSAVINATTYNNELEPFEKDLLRYIVKYANRTVEWQLEEGNDEGSENDDIKTGKRITVCEYIALNLEDDELELSAEIHTLILKDALKHCSQPNFQPEQYFLNHPNPDISRLAVDLISDKYPLSKVHSKFQQIRKESERLKDVIPYIVLVYKDAILKKHISELTLKIKQLSEADNFEEVVKMMKELGELKETQKIISKYTGERIVLKM